MKKTLQALFVSVFIALLLVTPAFATVNLDNYPRLDSMTSVVCSNEADMIIKAQGGAVDTAYDIRKPVNVQTLDDLGWTISTNEAYGFHYWAINCRTVTTPESGKYLDYHGRTPGQAVLFPLNVSEFRFALHLLVGGSVTDNALSEVFGWTQKRIDTIPAPAAGQWYNSELPPMPLDPEGALVLLDSVGINNDTGYWRNTNADIGPLGELRTIWVLGCPEALESTTEMSIRYRAEWNKFFGKKSDGTSDYFGFDLIGWDTGFGEIVWLQRDFDIEGAGWNVGRDPDYLFDFFHSSKDGEDDYNLPGIHNAELDELLYAIKYWRWSNGTYITELSDLVDVAWLAEEYLYYLTPYMVKYCAVATNAFVPGTKSWIESLGYGSDNGYTYNWIYWTDMEKTSIKQANSGPPQKLNPGTASTVYEFAILNRIYDGLYDIEPFDHTDIMWAMKSYTIEPWTYDVDEPGQKVTVTLRSGIHWHDGDPVTSADIKWNYDFIMNASFNRYSDILLTYDHTEIIDDTHFTIYIKCTGIWTVYIYFGSALLFPQKIWEPWLGDPAGAASWTPWTVNYDVWTGETGHGDLTCLIGTGAWVFVEWDQPGGAAYLVANRPDAVWTGNPGYWAGVHVGSEVKGMMREDIDFSGRIDMIDMWTAQKAFGAVPGNPRWHYGRGDTDASSRIDMVDMWRIQKRFGKITLPA